MLSSGLRFLPMEIDVLPQAGGKNADAPTGFDLAAIVADVMDSGFRIPSKPMRTSGVGTVVKTRSGNRHWESVETTAFFIQLVTEVNDVVAFPGIHTT